MVNYQKRLFRKNNPGIGCAMILLSGELVRGNKTTNVLSKLL